MKLRDAIANKDYSMFKKDKYPSFCNYYDTLSEIIYPHENDISDEHYQAVEDSGRLEKYTIREWICTDTNVGLYLYLIDGEPVCISYQPARKSDPAWEFFTKEALEKTRKLFDDCRPSIESDSYTPLVNEDLMELVLHEDLFDSDINAEQMGLSPLLGHERMIGNLIEKPEVLTKDSYFVDYMRDVLDEHDKFLNLIEAENDPITLNRYTGRSQVLYDKCLELIKEYENAT